MKSFVFSQLGSSILELPLLSFIYLFLLEYYLISNRVILMTLSFPGGRG